MPTVEPVIAPARRRTWPLAGWALLAGFAAIVLLVPLEDPDVWWHIKTGEVIASTGSLPASDPFGEPGAAATGPTAFLLRSYWLGQLALHAAHEAAGLRGIVVLRSMVVAAMFVAVYWRIRRRGVGQAATVGFVAAALALFARFHYAERPQVYSFLGVTLLLGLVEGALLTGRGSWLVIPLMAIWSNLHGGFVVGDAMLALVAGIWLLRHRRAPRAALPLVGWAAAAVLASALNPCGLEAFTFALRSGSDPMTRLLNDEYVNAWELVRQGNQAILIVWAIVAAATVGLALRPRSTEDLSIWAFGTALSLAFVRNIGFLLVGLAPLWATGLVRATSRLPSRLRRATPILAGVGALSLVAWQSAASVRRGSPLRWELGRDYPARAADFLAQVGGCRKIFDEYDWGGYLIWRLAPRSQVLVDGRLLDPSVVPDYGSIVWADERPGQPGFSQRLDRRGLDCVVQRDFLAFGDLSPLATGLLETPGWMPVYVDEQAFVFMRESPANAAALQRHGMSREAFVASLREALQTAARLAPSDYRPQLASGQLLAAAGHPREAALAFRDALRLAPGNAWVMQRIRQAGF